MTAIPTEPAWSRKLLAMAAKLDNNLAASCFSQVEYSGETGSASPPANQYHSWGQQVGGGHDQPPFRALSLPMLSQYKAYPIVEMYDGDKGNFAEFYTSLVSPMTIPATVSSMAQRTSQTTTSPCVD
eukprot:gene19069-25673_t